MPGSVKLFETSAAVLAAAADGGRGAKGGARGGGRAGAEWGNIFLLGMQNFYSATLRFQFKHLCRILSNFELGPKNEPCVFSFEAIR